jgi:hypothetical protein
VAGFDAPSGGGVYAPLDRFGWQTIHSKRRPLAGLPVNRRSELLFVKWLRLVLSHADSTQKSEKPFTISVFGPVDLKSFLPLHSCFIVPNFFDIFIFDLPSIAVSNPDCGIPRLDLHRNPEAVP